MPVHSRRRRPALLRRVAALLLLGLAFWPIPAPAGEAGTRLRIVTGNLTSGRYQSYDPGHGSRILQALRPDVALIQEMNIGDKSDAALKGWVRAVFGPEFFVYREEGEIPNGIVSRWPILASGEWDDPEVTNRDFAWARLDLPGDRDLWVISVHFLARKPGRRADEADALLRFIRQHVPERDFLVLGGDFNTTSRLESCVRALAAVLVVAPPFPVDERGIEGTNAKRNHPYDWILADADLEPYKTPVVLGSARFPGGLVFDSRTFPALAEVPPVQRDDSGAEQMQHMAVVRDFIIPAEKAGAADPSSSDPR